MELTTIELAKKLIEKADKIDADFKTAFSKNDGGYYIKCYLENNEFYIVIHEDYIYVSKEGYQFTISMDKNININETKYEIQQLVFNNIHKVMISDSIESDCELKEKLKEHIIKNDINYILEYKK